jgi:hypothetical protein
MLTNNISISISDLTTNIIDCADKLPFSGNCCSQSEKLNAKPWAYKIDTGGGVNHGSPLIKRRPEEGWT